MRTIKAIFQSSLGKKYLMAVTGFFLFLFVIGHLVGNLQIFLGPEAINRYGYFLQSNIDLLWPVRVILLTILVVHLWAATKLSLENRAARPVGYAVYAGAINGMRENEALRTVGIVSGFAKMTAHKLRRDGKHQRRLGVVGVPVFTIAEMHLTDPCTDCGRVDKRHHEIVMLRAKQLERTPERCCIPDVSIYDKEPPDPAMVCRCSDLIGGAD